MTNYIGWTPPPGVAVVPPPVHPRTVVDVIYSDASNDLHWIARDLNWSAVGDGPAIVAYAVVSEYKPAPEPREWWTVGKHMHDSEAEADEFRKACALLSGNSDHLYTPIIHVREVTPAAREVVAWAVFSDEQRMLLTGSAVAAKQYADRHGGTVVKLTGVMPNE